MIFNNILCRFYRPKVNPRTTSLHPFNHAFLLKSSPSRFLKGEKTKQKGIHYPP